MDDAAYARLSCLWNIFIHVRRQWQIQKTIPEGI